MSRPGPRADKVDVFIAGGGIAGLAAAAAFGSAGFSVVCVDPQPPVASGTEPGADLRTTAFLQPARDFLEAAGLWARLAPHAAPLQVMRIVEAGTDSAEPLVVRDFDAADISESPFGWNLPNWLLRREMVARLEELPQVAFRPGVGLAGIVTQSAAARIRLSDGQRLAARLVIAADGRDSPTREALGLGTRTTRFGQKALAFAVTHDAPHRNVSTEIHRAGGPFTLVPLPDIEGRPASAVVWMDQGPRILELARLDEDSFNAAMTARSARMLGSLRLASRRSVWPIIARRATRLTAERVALVAEAAHVVPPIGAQGLNMSLTDLAQLLALARAAPERIGEQPMLRRYERARMPDVIARMAGIGLLNRASIAGAPPLRAARALGLRLIHDAAPVRRGLMRLGLGVKG